MMTNLTTLINKKVRRIEENGEWYFSIEDIIALLVDNCNPIEYWNELKIKLEKEGFTQLPKRIKKLKLVEYVNLETTFRIIQSIQSPKAEQIKQQLVKVGCERIEEIKNPDIIQQRVIQNYRQKGYDDEWIELRIQNVLNRQNLTDEWNNRGASDYDHETFTNILSKETFDIDCNKHKEIKGLKRENLRDHMTPFELILTSLGELTAREIHKAKNTTGRDNLKEDVIRAGKVAGDTRKEIEKAIGKPVVSSENYLGLREIKNIKE